VDQKNDGKRYAALLAGFVVWVLAALPVAADFDAPGPFYWDRIDDLSETGDWTLVSQSKLHRRLKCTACEDDVILTFSIKIPIESDDVRYSGSEASSAYQHDRRERCRVLVQSNEGRCIKTQDSRARGSVKGFRSTTELSGNRTEHEVVYFMYGGFVWADVAGPRSNEVVSTAGNALPHLLLGITPFY
jgi:hypothetical protein